MDASVNRIPSSKDERAYLIALQGKHDDPKDIDYSLNELMLLVKTAGGIVVDRRVVRRSMIDPAYIVGRGVKDELRVIVQERGIKLLVFDLNNLKPAQIRNLEEELQCRVVGRTEVILDIFARRARSAESKIQVELAQLRYILPRLKGLGGVLSRLGGGIGTRGPGEKMLETDRRHIMKRITVLSRKLKGIKSHRELSRKSRAGEFVGAVVGYTNAGKSSLINTLARDDLFVEDKLFATLESYTRVVYLSPGAKVLLTDTVGFIRNLPANLVESFRSTLEEIEHADFLLHVADISSEDIDTNICTVESELRSIRCADKPVILFLNKSDLREDLSSIRHVQRRYPGSIVGSVKTGDGLDELVETIGQLHHSLYSHPTRRRPASV
ncbi:MAG: GTPase HflX [Spirochaetes bacterium]|nr:GTPase HflX [Spirochaetota bacterium]